MTASKLHVLKAWWSQLENVVNVMDEDAGIESDRRLFYNKVPLATWKNQDIFLSACIKMLGAMYNMTCSYMQDKNSFYVGATPGLAYMDPIKNACTVNDLARVDILIDGGYDLNKTDRRGQNALYKAVDACCSIPLVGKILDNITDVNAHDDEGKTALMWATQYSEAEHVKLLMEHPNVDPNVQNRYGMTALHLAVTYNCVPTITELLNGENIDCTLLDCEGITPLQMAVDAVRPACEQLLRAHGAPMYGSYQHAFEADDEETEQSVNALLNMDRDPNEVDEHGYNALHRAAREGCRPPLFQRVLARIHDVNAVIEYGFTALMIAAIGDQVDVVTVLMNHRGVDLNVQCRISNYTALHYAVLHENPAIVSQLLSDDKIDASLKDDDNYTALQRAIDRGSTECAQILRAHFST